MSRLWTEEGARLFVACDLPENVRREVSSWQRSELEGREGVRVNSSLHLTLAFLGDVKASRVDRVAEALRAVTVEPARAALAEPLFLPSHGRRRVVALEVLDLDGRLARLQSDVTTALVGDDLYRPEKRPWLAHLTVARFRRPGHPFPLQNVNVGEFCVVRMVLYSSLLEHSGAVHVPLAVFSAS